MRRSSIVSVGSARAANDADDDEFVDAPVEILPKEINLAGDTDDKLPNTLVITAIQARKLQTAALRSTLSCYVKLSSLGRECKTSVVSKNDEPFWNETFSFRAIDWASSVTLSLRDKINVKMRFLGQTRVSCTEVAAEPGMVMQRWYPLRDKNWERRPGNDAEIELKVALVYTKKNDPNVAKDLATGAGDDEDEMVGVAADQDDETEEEAFARRKELERLENERKNTLYAGINQGDYQIQVHVIEARGLKAENLSGTSDPYVQVEVMDQKKKTSTKDETLDCVFDEILFFHFTNIGRNELKQASIKLSIFDKELIFMDNLIGSYQLDCLSVYFRPHHELYRQWVAVHDHLNENDRGIQGYLLVSITIIGPGDTFVVHDREAELAKELAEAAAAASLLETKGKASTSSNFAAATQAALNPDGQSIVLLPPTIDFKLHFLVVKVFKAEGLPAMDEGLMVTSGIDAFVQIGFGANAPCKSSVVTVKGASNLSPEFLEELWIPVMAPTLCRYISISIWDRDVGRKDELVGVTYHDYQTVASASSPGGILAAPESPEAVEARRLQELERLESGEVDPEAFEKEQVTLRWFNLYGPPLKRINKKRGAWIAQNPDSGSTYRGRVLLSMERVEKAMPEENEKCHVKPMKEMTPAKLESQLPKTVKYVLRCALFCGVDLPVSNSGLPGLAASSTRVRVSLAIGSYEIHFESLTVDKFGCANWEECKERWPIVLPADLTQLPDIIVTLSRQIDKETFVSISYTRFLASDYFQQAFTNKCEWVQLHEDISRRQTKHALDKTQSPGSLLLRLGFGREEVAVRTPWGDDTTLFKAFRHHRVHREIRVNIYQFRKLYLPEGRLKAPSPFVSVRCCGQVQKTETKTKTLDPLYYVTLVFKVHVPHDVAYSPDVVFYVHDANISTSTSVSIPNAILGELRIPMSRAQGSVKGATPPRPSWYPLCSRSSDAHNTSAAMVIEEPRGQALISIQYIDHKDVIQSVPPSDTNALIPKEEDVYLEIVAIGVRQLKARSLLGIRNPMVECELTGARFSDARDPKLWRSKPATAWGKNGKNANLLERVVLSAKLPVDTLYAPQLTIRVLESTMGGLRKTVLASSVVDLAPKLPWSADYAQQLEEQPAFENPPVAAAVDAPASRRRSILERLNLRRKSQPEKAGKEPLFSDEDEKEEPAEPEKENIDVQADDGLGVGDLPRSINPPLWVSPLHAQLQDPAVQDQLAREEQRRYLAGQADLFRGGKGHDMQIPSSVYNAPGAATNATSAKPGEVVSPAHNNGGVAAYQQGRDWWINKGGEELENYLKGKALESYPLFRSVLTRPSLLQRKRVRVQVKAGVFKGVITVTEKRKKQGRSDGSLVDLQKLKEHHDVVVRVYVLRGYSLQAKDLNGFSDPYLRLKLGKEIQSDRENYKKETLNPDFFKMFTFQTKLPGASQLEIGVWDRDFIPTNDDFIGSTTIDLEDRWFHREWQRLDTPGISTERALNNLTRVPVKPIENRHLYTSKRATSQGILQVWVDILTAQQAAALPPTNIQLPDPKKYEVRVVIWRGENIEDKDGSGINDYFVKVWMEGGKPETTDIHWRCSNGKPSWNWRFKLPVEFPMRTSEFGRLHVQLWDKDVLKWNDMIGEAQLDLYKWIRRAYETNRPVTPFMELKALSQSLSGRKIVPKAAEANELNANDEIDDADEDEDDGDDDDEEDDDEDETVSRGYGTKETNSLLMRNQGAKSKPSKQIVKSSKANKKSEKLDEKRKRKIRKARDDAEAKLALSGLLSFFGKGALPDEADWVPIMYNDRDLGKTIPMGKLAVGIEIVPIREAEMHPVGKGRESPNENPYLPPPVGRMRFTVNPFMMLKQLMSGDAFMKLMCACCCLCCVLLFATFGATIMSALVFYEEMGRSSGTEYKMPDYPHSPYTSTMTIAPSASSPAFSPATAPVVPPSNTTSTEAAEDSDGSNGSER